MSADVVRLLPKERPDLIWICDCGCSTHRHYADGRVECASCSNTASISDDGWRRLMPESPLPPRPLESSFALTDLQDVEPFLRRRAKEAAGVAAVLVIYHDGEAATWVRGETATRQDWLTTKVGAALAQLLGLHPKA